MAEDTMFIPTLGESQEDVLVTPEDKAEYIVAFSLINPGFTSDNMEAYIISFSSILAEHSTDLEAVVTEYNRQLQEAIDITCPGSGLEVVVSKSNTTETEVTISITVISATSGVVLNIDKVAKRLGI